MINFADFDSIVEAIRNDAQIECQMEIESLENPETLTVTNGDLVSQTFTLDRYCQSSNSLEVGSVCAAELSFSLLNYDGKFNGFKFEGGKIRLCVRIVDPEVSESAPTIEGIQLMSSDGYVLADFSGAILTVSNESTTFDVAAVSERPWIMIGEFVIDEKPKSLNTISIVALDRMVVFDRLIDWENFRWTSKITTLVNTICDDCNVVLASDALSKLNSQANLPNAPTESELTYRQLLQQLLQISFCNAFINEEGKLDFAWYNNTGSDSAFKLMTGDRFTSSLEEKSLRIRNVKSNVLDSSGNETHGSLPPLYADGTSGDEVGDFDLIIEGNDVLNVNEALDIYTYRDWNDKMCNLDFVRSFSATTLPFFFLQPMDKIVFVTSDNEEVSTTVTHITFKLNAGTKIECRLPTLSNSGYASMGALTANEKKLLEKIRLKSKQFDGSEKLEEISKREEALIAYNKAINNGAYLHKTEINGNVYYHDAEEITASTYIIVHNSAGVAWTNDPDWDESDPGNPEKLTFTYGFSKDGDTFLENIFARYICADVIQTGILSAINGSSYFDLDTGTFVSAASSGNSVKIYNGTIIQTLENQARTSNTTSLFFDDEGTIFFCDLTVIEPIDNDNDGKVLPTGFGRCAYDKDLNLIRILTETPTVHSFHSQITTCKNRSEATTGGSQGQQFAGFKHYRYVDEKQYNTALGIGVIDNRPTTALELKNEDNTIMARVDFYRDYSDEGGLRTGSIKIRARMMNDNKNYYSAIVRLCPEGLDVTDGGYSINRKKVVSFKTTATTLGDYYEFGNGSYDVKINAQSCVWIENASVIAELFEVTSTEDIKTNIASVDTALTLFEKEKSQIYSYNLIKRNAETSSDEFSTMSTTEEEIKVSETTTFGFVIGENYAVPSEVLSDDGKHINLYSMASINWKATQELYEELIEAKKRISDLENQLSGGQAIND